MKKCEDYNYAWIHLEQLPFFIYLGANECEQSIGQNITIDISIQINYVDTRDLLQNTVDYGLVFQSIKSKIESLGCVRLLERLAEEILTHIESSFYSIRACPHKSIPHNCGGVGRAAKLRIKKGYPHN